MSMRGWIGFDLDGTLAIYEGWKGTEHIGAPVPRMVERLKWYLAQNKKVKIFTARVCGTLLTEEQVRETRRVIEAWCREHIGQTLEITNVKDMFMERLYDDRAVGVKIDTGLIYCGLEGEESHDALKSQLESMRLLLHRAEAACGKVRHRLLNARTGLTHRDLSEGINDALALLEEK